MTNNQSVELNLDGMAFSIKLGCSSEERSFPQVVEFDVSVSLGVGKDYSRDSINETVDYLHVSNAIERLAKEMEWQLLEKLCQDCAREILAISDLITAVTVKATKRRVAHIRGVSCKITVFRE